MPKFISVAKNILLDEKLFRRFSNLWGEKRIFKIFNAIRRPTSRYYVRVNTTKTSRENIIERFENYGLKPKEDKELDEAIYFKVGGPNKIPKAEKWVMVDKRTAESALNGSDVYVPGIINPNRMKKGEKVNIISPWKDVVAFGEVKINWYELRRNKKGLAIENVIPLFKAPKIRETKEFYEGLFYIQSLPAMLTSKILDPKENETIVDMCAAPGGKTTHIAEITKNKSKIFAFDHSKRRVQKLREEVRRLGHRSIKVILHDSRYIDLDFKWIRADKVLLDPPCSSLGVRPKIHEKKTMKEVYSFSNYQKQFIKAAYKILKRNGVLVYSTCTLTPEENEMNIEFAKSLGFKIDEQHIRIGEKGLSIIDENEKLQRFYPNKGPYPGYFIARMIKK